MSKHLLALTALMLFALTLIGPVSTATAAGKQRTLTGISVEADNETARITFDLEKNNGRRLGKVYFSGKTVKILVEDTKLAKNREIKMPGHDDTLKGITVKQSKSDVVVQLKLEDKITSILEHLVFEPYANHSVLTIRKPGFYAARAKAVEELAAAKPSPAETKVVQVQAVAPVKAKADNNNKLVDMLPLVEPEAKPVEPKKAVAAEKTVSKQETLASLRKGMEKTPAEATEVAAVPVAASLGTAPAGGVSSTGTSGTSGMSKPFKVGNAAPDLTGLYVMTVAVLLIAAVWFFFRRGRLVSFTKVEEPIQVVKSTNIGHRQRLLVVETEGKRLLLAASDKQVNFLSDLTVSDSTALQKREAPAEPTNVHPFRQQSAAQSEADTSSMFGQAQQPTQPASGRPSYFGGKAPQMNSGAAPKPRFEEQSQPMTFAEKLRAMKRRA